MDDSITDNPGSVSVKLGYSMMYRLGALRLWRLSANRKLVNGSSSSEVAIKRLPLTEIKDDLSRFLREAEKQEIAITRHESLPVSDRFRD